MRNFFIRLTLALMLLQTGLGTTLQAQSIYRPELDSLRRVLAGSKADTNRVRVLLRLGEDHIKKLRRVGVDLDSAYKYAREAQHLSRSLRYTGGFDQSQRLLAQVAYGRRQIDQLKALLKNSKKKNRATFLWLLGEYHLNRAGEAKAYLDSAQDYGQQALLLHRQGKDLPGQAASLLTLGKVSAERGDQAKALGYYHQTPAIIGRVPDRVEQARMWFMLGDTYGYSVEEMPEKIPHFERALALYRQTGKKEEEAHVLKAIADMHQYQGKYAQSLRELLEVLHIQRSIGSKLLHYTYDLLGHVHRTMGNYEQALPYAMASVESAKANADTTDLILFYSRMGTIYRELGQWQPALDTYQLLLTKLQREGYIDGYHNLTRSSIMSIVGLINKALLALNRPQQAISFLRQTLQQYPPLSRMDQLVAAYWLGEGYLGLKSYTTAENYFLDALRETNPTKPEENDIIIAIHLELISLHISKGQYQKARYHLDQASRGKKRSVSGLMALHKHAFQLDSLQGKLSSAIAHYQQYTTLKDSLFNARKSNQLIAFQVQYDTERKEQEIKLKEQNIKALTNERQLQEAQIKKDELVRNVIIGGAVLLLLLLGVIYNRYHLKQRSNQLLEAQQKVLKAQQKEIHEKNEHLSQLLGEKDSLLVQKDTLIEEKDGLLTEKEWLLKEIHHRVKNNLQVVMSLLDSQADSLQDKAALSAIQESQHRVQAMALIHQKLYQSESLARIPMTEYIEELVAYLNDSYSLYLYQPIGFDVEVEDIELDVTLAVPLGLIINEVITNAFKYAFPHERSGRITVHLKRMEEASYELMIADDGVGLPASYDPSSSRSLGMTLIHGFSRQLGGKLTIASPPGMRINLIFQETNLNPIYNVTSYGY